ncbi:hypothetical protein FIV42_15300 [Persicimonas caeni]|uniref:Uncharacterized protein n=1 Tax=Persicimonas caeni TaxID=2292766 RepID=A0A4Y6PUS5_PERCE|nr:hypothetical protein [Persicimonas caeni]QDG52058.1 hypothetical protein FIV42_15300 [Persicimonas caeni]QED33279.1 hypothetical protein FRD00_15295 [Persicimonas caeni]
MAASSDFHGADSPVLDFDLTSFPFRWNPKTKQWLLWPFWAYRVVVPLPQPEPFNLFERFLLKAAHAGARGTTRLSEVLQLDGEMVDFLMERMRRQGHVDEYGVPSDSAIEQLREFENQEPELKTGRVFVDAITGRLWPRFEADAMQLVDSQITPNGSATVRMGGPARSRLTDAFVVWPDHHGSPPPQAPDSYAIGNAVRGHFRRIDVWERRTGFYHKGSIGVPVSQIDGGRLVDPEPEAVFAATCVFVPSDVIRSSSWQVCDPFGLGPSPRLRRTMAQMMEQGANNLRDKVKKATGDGYGVDTVEFAEILEIQLRRAAREVEDEVGPLDRLPDGVLSGLLQTQEALNKMTEGVTEGGEGLTAADKEARSVLRCAYRAVEDALRFVVGDHAGTSVVGGFGENAAGNASVLHGVIRRLGGHIDQDEATSLLKVTQGQAFGVVGYDNRELRALLAVSIMTAADMPQHPMRRAFKENPGLVDFLYELHSERGTAAHASSKEVPIQRIAELVEQVRRFVRALFPTPAEVGDSVLAEAGGGWDAEMMCRIRASARQAVESRVPQVREASPKLKGNLVDMEQCAIEIDWLVDDGASSIGPGLDRRLRDLVISGASAVEAAVQELVATTPPIEEAGDYLDNSRALLELAAKMGFMLNREGALPRDLLKVRAERLEHALQRGKGSLNALVWAGLIRGAEGRETMVRRLSKLQPDWLLKIGELSRRRGHGAERRIEPEEQREVAEMVYKIVDAALTTVSESE